MSFGVTVIASCFIGATTKRATSVGRIAPNTIDAGMKLLRIRPSAATRMIPHTPPQNESEMTDGTPSGGTAFIAYGIRDATPSTLRIQSAG